MKKIYISFSAILFSVFQISAQVPTCTLDPVFIASPKVGISPDSVTNFAPGTVGVPYVQNITVKVPLDTVDPSTGLTVCFNRFVLSNPTGVTNFNLPPGLSMGSSTAALSNGTVNGSPSLKFPGNANNCASIYGTPTTAGTYTLSMQVDAFGTPLLFGGNCPASPNAGGGTQLNTTVIGYYVIVINPNTTGMQETGVNTLNMENIPNPFSGKTKIKFFVREADDAELIVHDVLGNKVFSTKTKTTPGENEVLFDGSNLSSGMFFYTIKYRNFAETKRMIIHAD
ncbi:MAG: T9SS type A sorting domain-containing protein [Bacteroidota bacterium]|jgi:hypothetical protein